MAPRTLALFPIPFARRIEQIQIHLRADQANSKLEKPEPTPVSRDVRNFFPAGHKPASMVIGVSALAYPGLLVEINVRAATD